MIKKMRESKIIDFDIVVIVSAVIICLVMFIAIKIKEMDFSIVDIYAETIQKETITSTNTLGEVEGTVESRVMLSSGGLIDTRYGIGVSPVITTDQMVEWGLRKGNELISILQIFAQPLCIVVFIFGCGKTLIGFFIGTAGKGLMPMGLSAIIYAAILYSPILVNSLVSFSAN